MNFLDLFERQQQVEASARSASAARDAARQAIGDLHELRRRLDTLALANQALFEILVERLGLQEADVLTRMREIDLRDGVADRRMGGRPLACPRCRRTSNTAKTECIYCGAPIGGHLFQKT